MKRIVQVVAAALLLTGAVWLFQGLGVLPGSFMTGQRRWAINGVIALAAGALLLVAARRMGPPSMPTPP